MHKYLIDMLQCPMCHGELEWTIHRENLNRIEEGEAICKSCGAHYPIKDEIGIFLTPKLDRNDLWEQNDDQLTKYFEEYPEIEKRLMDCELESLSPADQFIRAFALEEKKKYDEAFKAFKIAWKGIYTEDYQSCWNKQMDYICTSLNPSDTVVDLASGRCYLVEKMAKKANCFIVATDFSPTVLRRNRLVLKDMNLYDKISLLSFDARLTPFKDGAIKILTSNLGLPNIENPGDLLKELRRITSGKLMSVNHFYPENDEMHREAFKKHSLETFVYRSNTIDCFAKAGWKLEIENSCFGLAKPTPEGQIIEGVKIDIFPLKDIEMEWCVLTAK